ncbi:MAG: M23 family metallopeptidase [Campylobacterota bacterium]
MSQSPYFERNAPVINADETIYWNRKDPLQVAISDNVGIKHYRAQLHDGSEAVATISKNVDDRAKEVMVQIEYPNMGFGYNKDRFTLNIEATDTSFWNFFKGNRNTQTIEVVVDRSKPLVSIIENSYGISQGGSALVVFQAKDANLVDLYIETNYGKTFDVVPFYKENYYIALVAWPVPQDRFRASIVAKDIAGNETTRKIPYYLKAKRYKKSDITLKKRFLDNEIAALADDFVRFRGIENNIEKFRGLNEDLRKENTRLIEEASQITDFTRIDDFSIDPFYPLKNAAAVASFGDHRTYYDDAGNKVSTSYHLGLDLASVKNAPVHLSNPGTVKYASDNGLYGNMPLVSHGLGLHSLYGHCSEMNVEQGQQVGAKDVIAHTGATGLAFGDHLHFGISIQGVEVRPEEWMDANWIKLNVDEVIKQSKEIIDIQKK